MVLISREGKIVSVGAEVSGTSDADVAVVVVTRGSVSVTEGSGLREHEQTLTRSDAVKIMAITDLFISRTSYFSYYSLTGRSG
jgi:hypothetical protein